MSKNVSTFYFSWCFQIIIQGNVTLFLKTRFLVMSLSSVAARQVCLRRGWGSAAAGVPAPRARRGLCPPARARRGLVGGVGRAGSAQLSIATGRGACCRLISTLWKTFLFTVFLWFSNSHSISSISVSIHFPLWLGAGLGGAEGTLPLSWVRQASGKGSFSVVGRRQHGCHCVVSECVTCVSRMYVYTPDPFFMLHSKQFKKEVILKTSFPFTSRLAVLLFCLHHETVPSRITFQTGQPPWVI